MNRGSALVDTLLAALIAALLLQGAVAAAHLQAAGEQAQEAAAVAASWAARYGDPEGGEALAADLAPDAESVAVRRDGAGLSAVVRIRVPLAGPRGEVSRVVVGRATAGISPYRSNRG